MKKILILLLLLTLTFPQVAISNEIDGEYRKKILNSGFLFETSGFFEAIRKNNSEVVKLFLQAGINPNATFTGTPAVMHALFLNKMDIFEILLKAGADPETEVPALWVSAKPQNLLSFAIKRKNATAVKILVDNGVDVNKKFNNKMPLNYALATKQAEIAELLIKAGAKADKKTTEPTKSEKTNIHANNVQDM